MRSLLALVRKELLYLRAYPLDLLNLAVSPGLLVAPYLLVARMFGVDPDFESSVAVGLILWYWLSQLFWWVGHGIAEEMEEGVLESLLVTPAPLVTILGAKAIAGTLTSAYITAGIIGWFFAFGLSIPVPWPAFVGIMFLTGLGLTGFCTAYAGVVLLVKQAESIGSGMQTALGVLAGMTVPPQVFPRAVWVISRAIPLTYGIEAARRLLRRDEIRGEVTWLVVTGIAFALLGWALLKRAERRMKAAGTTGEF